MRPTSDLPASPILPPPSPPPGEESLVLFRVAVIPIYGPPNPLLAPSGDHDEAVLPEDLQSPRQSLPDARHDSVPSRSPTYQRPSPQYRPQSPPYIQYYSPPYVPQSLPYIQYYSPPYVPQSPPYAPQSPLYAPQSPPYAPQSPPYTQYYSVPSRSPTYQPLSPQYLTPDQLPNGGSGYDPDRFVDKVPDRLICSICHSVMNCPVETPCSHVFCCLCIRAALKHNPRCPFDRQLLSLSNLRPLPRILHRLLGDLRLQCTFNGCTAVVPLDDLANHEASCQHRTT